MQPVDYNIVIENLVSDLSEFWFADPSVVSFPELEGFSKDEAIGFFKRLIDKEEKENNKNKDKEK